MDEKKEIEELAEILKQAFYKSSEVHSNEIREALKNGAKHYGSRDFKKSMFDYMAEAVILAGYRKDDGLMDEIAGLTGKVEALQQDNENLRRTLKEGRSYEYRDSCAGCELENICKYAEHYNFCEDCKEYPDCPIIGYDELPCGRTVECNNGFEEKSYLDDEDEEEVDE